MSELCLFVWWKDLNNLSNHAYLHSCKEGHSVESFANVRPHSYCDTPFWSTVHVRVCVCTLIFLFYKNTWVCCWPVVFGNWSDTLSTINSSLDVTISFSTRSLCLCVFRRIHNLLGCFTGSILVIIEETCVCNCGGVWVGGLGYHIALSKDNLAIETNETRRTCRSHSYGMLFYFKCLD